MSRHIKEKKNMGVHIEKLQMFIRNQADLLQKTVLLNQEKTQELKDLREEIINQAKEMKEQIEK